MVKVERQGAVFVLSGDQPLTHDHAGELSEALDAAFRGGQPLAVVNLQQVPLIDSAGLELLADAQNRFERHGGCLKIAGANPLCRDILRCTGLSERLELHGDVKAAVGSFVR